MQLKVSPVLAASLALIFLLVVASMGSTFYFSARLWKNIASVEHTDRVSLELESVLSSLKDAETGKRGYLLTGKPEYLEPYTTAVAAIPEKLATVGELTRDNNVQQQHLRRVRVSTNEKLRELDKIIRLFNDQGFAAARSAMLLGSGKAVMDALRLDIRTMQAEEARLRVLRADVAATNYRYLIIRDLATGSAALVAILAFFSLLRRYVADRNAQLQISRQYLQTTLTSIGDAVITTDGNGNITNLNALAETWTGWTEATAVGKPLSSVFSVINSTNRQPVDYLATRAAGNDASGEMILVSKDGSEISIEGRSTALSGEPGHGLVLVFRDVSERKLTEQRLHQALLDTARLQESRQTTEVMRSALYERERQQQAVDAHAIVSVADAAGLITYANNKLCTVSGYSRDALLGNDHCMFKSGAHPPAFYESMWQTISSGAIWSGEICNRGCDGSLYWLDASIVPFLDVDGQPYQYIMIATDVTLIKLSQAALVASEERLQRGQTFANMATWEWDVGRNTVFWSAGMAPLLGHAQGTLESSYDNYVNAIHPDDHARFLEALNACIENDTPFDIEHRLVWPDGAVYWVLNRGNVLRDVAGKATNMVGVVQDINKRKTIELALIESEQRLQQAQTLAQLGHWQVTFPDLALHWSAEVYKILGLDPISYKPGLSSFHDATHPDDLMRVDESIAHSKQSGMLDMTHRIIRKDGATRHVRQQARAEWTADDKLLRLSGTVQDMTDYVEAKEQLRQSEERFAFAVDGAGDGIWDWQIQKDTMLLSNQCEAMMGYDRGELAPTVNNWDRAIHRDEQALIHQTLHAYLSGKITNYRVEFRMRCKDGSFKWVLSRGTVVARDSENRPVRMIGILSDISAQKALQTELVAARENAERASQAKSEFLSSMSHELRTPMNAILGFAQLMELDSRLTEDQHEDVHEILKGGRHLLQLINEVLDLAKVESGTMTLSLESVTLADLVEECRQLIRPLAQARQITLRCSVPAHAAVRADRTRLKQVLFNLFSNAVKYNQHGGDVHLNVQSAPDRRWRITVTDTGAGIAPEHLKTLFEPFHRLNADDATIEGAGIGLTITQRLVQMMGGMVGVDSKIGAGSAFWIELSGDAITALDDIAATTADENLAALPVPASTQRVLCIDDNPANLRLIARILASDPNIDLVGAHTPMLGIDLALAHRPALILLDVNMPGMDGYQVLEVLKADANLKTVPVIAITANAMPHDIERGRAAGFADYITKPIDVDRFSSVIERLLKSSKEKTE